MNSTDLVFSVGSGRNPYPGYNLLLDAYQGTCGRHRALFLTERSTILGTVESLPFKDNAFDLGIRFHVLKYSSYR